MAWFLSSSVAEWIDVPNNRLSTLEICWRTWHRSCNWSFDTNRHKHPSWWFLRRSPRSSPSSCSNITINIIKRIKCSLLSPFYSNYMNLSFLRLLALYRPSKGTAQDRSVDRPNRMRKRKQPEDGTPLNLSIPWTVCKVSFANQSTGNGNVFIMGCDGD